MIAPLTFVVGVGEISMKNLGWLVLAIVIAYGSAIAAFLVRQRFRGRAGVFAGWCFVAIIVACPLLIPSASVGLRAASAFVSGDIFFRIVDLFRQWAGAGPSIALRDYCIFLIPFPVLSIVYPDHKRRLKRPDLSSLQRRRVVVGILGVVIALLMLLALSKPAWVQSSFALNHVVMLVTFVLAIESLSRALCGLERMAGFDTTPIIQNAYVSRTVSEFWRRYNNRVHDWFYRNVFRATGGRRTPVRSLLLVFLVSGLFHEVAFAIATSRITGYQFAFFTIQGPAALASGHLERLARRRGIIGKIMAHAATIVFLAVTSVLFFEGVDRIFPFIYASESPLP